MTKTTSNLSLRLEPEEWPALCREPGFEEYYVKVTDFFYCMKPGQIVRLESQKHLRWLIKSACMFVVTGDNWEHYQLNDDFTKLRRLRTVFPTQYEKEVIRRFHEEHK